jgi:quercetin dioxygenase-like cupin family protein
MGEVITDREARFVAILVDRPELALTLSRYDEGEKGPGPHLHREHADSFLILSGGLRFELAGVPRTLEPGELLLAPPHLVHTLLNERPEPAWWLNFHTPQTGFLTTMRARRDGAESPPWDSFPAEPEDGLPVSAALAGESFASEWLRVERLRLAAGEEAERQVAGLSVVAAVSGEVRVRADGLDTRVERHGVAVVPPGVTWRVVAAGPAADLVVTEVAQR